MLFMGKFFLSLLVLIPRLGIDERRLITAKCFSQGSLITIKLILKLKVFIFKVHPLGANLCLLEELDEGIIHELLLEGGSWWKQRFKSIKPWQENDVNYEWVVWVRVHGVSCHTWSLLFFERIANILGSYVCVDENTIAGCNMDKERTLLRVRFLFPVEGTFNGGHRWCKFYVDTS